MMESLLSGWLAMPFQHRGSVFFALVAVAALALVLFEIAWLVWKRKRAVTAKDPILDDKRCSFLWTGIPVFVVLCLASVEFDKRIKQAANAGIERPRQSFWLRNRLGHGIRPDVQPAAFRAAEKK